MIKPDPYNTHNERETDADAAHHNALDVSTPLTALFVNAQSQNATSAAESRNPSNQKWDAKASPTGDNNTDLDET